MPFPTPVDHILSDLSTMTRPSWVAPRACLGFIELDKAVSQAPDQGFRSGSVVKKLLAEQEPQETWV